jgi:hypothetical protein
VIIERHQVIEAGSENGWGRCVAPNFDLWRRGDREVQVFYFDDGSVNSAQSIDHRTKTTVAATRPDGLVSQVLQWLGAP